MAATRTSSEAPSVCGIGDLAHSEEPAGECYLQPSRLPEQYKVQRQLYKGVMSSVYEAVDRRTGAHVALKVYKKRLVGEPERAQLEREMGIHSGLCHPNVVELVTVFEDEKHLYLAQAFAKGGDLFTALAGAENGRFDEVRTAGTVIVPLLHALEYVHAKGIIHRDVKTENILFDADGALKLADFGLAIDTRTARPGTRLGTWEYMAPEIHLCPFLGEAATTDATYSSSVDVWAVGILAHELLVGRPPFERRHDDMRREDVMKELDLPSWLSPAACSFIRCALCLDPRRRPTASQLLMHRWLQPFSKEFQRREASQATTQSPLDLEVRVQLRPSKSAMAACPDSPAQPPVQSAIAAVAARLQHRPPSRVHSSAVLGDKFDVDHRRPAPAPALPRSPLSRRSGPMAAAQAAAGGGPRPGTPVPAPAGVGCRQDSGAGLQAQPSLTLPLLQSPTRASKSSVGSGESLAALTEGLAQRSCGNMDLQAPRTPNSGGASLHTPRRGSFEILRPTASADLGDPPRQQSPQARAWPPGPQDSDMDVAPASYHGLLTLSVLPTPPHSAFSTPLSRIRQGRVSSRSQPLPHLGLRRSRHMSQLLLLQGEDAGAASDGGGDGTGAACTRPAASAAVDRPAPPPGLPQRCATTAGRPGPEEDRRRRSASPGLKVAAGGGGGQSKVQALYSLGKALLLKLAKQDES